MATLESKISIPKDVVFRDVDGEAVILNLETGQYYGLDEVGTRMWDLLAEHGQVGAACRAMLDEYDVSEEQLKLDMLRLIDDLVSHGLVQVEGN